MSTPYVIDPALSGSGTRESPAPRLSHGRSIANSLSRPSPHSEGDFLSDKDLARERAQTWTGLSRFGFNAMLASPEYKNKLRLKPDKMERILYFLTAVEAKSREKDRADAQAKHQAQQWFLEDGILYRKDSRLEQPRRHVAADEAFDILTAEHLKSGHHGRDKMLKVLEAKYIGYTKDELMFVLEHCLVCSSKHIRGAAARRREHRQGNDHKNAMDQ